MPSNATCMTHGLCTHRHEYVCMSETSKMLFMCLIMQERTFMVSSSTSCSSLRSPSLLPVTVASLTSACSVCRHSGVHGPLVVCRAIVGECCAFWWLQLSALAYQLDDFGNPCGVDLQRACGHSVCCHSTCSTTVGGLMTQCRGRAIEAVRTASTSSRVCAGFYDAPSINATFCSAGFCLANASSCQPT